MTVSIELCSVAQTPLRVVDRSRDHKVYQAAHHSRNVFLQISMLSKPRPIHRTNSQLIFVFICSHKHTEILSFNGPDRKSYPTVCTKRFLPKAGLGPWTLRCSLGQYARQGNHELGRLLRTLWPPGGLLIRFSTLARGLHRYKQPAACRSLAGRPAVHSCKVVCPKAAMEAAVASP